VDAVAQGLWIRVEGLGRNPKNPKPGGKAWLDAVAQAFRPPNNQQPCHSPPTALHSPPSASPPCSAGPGFKTPKNENLNPKP
jgi:hypothetical protein